MATSVGRRSASFGGGVVADDLETIRKLIRLATDKSAAEAESRTAALKACKLILEKGVELVSTLKESQIHVGPPVASSGIHIDPSVAHDAANGFTPAEAEAFGFGKGAYRNRARSRHVPPSHPEARRRPGRVHDPIPDPSRTVVTVHETRYCGECGCSVAAQNQMAKRRSSDDVICMLCYALGKGYEEHQT
jgi:hypothetical protein